MNKPLGYSTYNSHVDDAGCMEAAIRSSQKSHGGWWLSQPCLSLIVPVMHSDIAHPFLPQSRRFHAIACEALEYDLKECAVFGMSNSGRTKELVRLYACQ